MPYVSPDGADLAEPVHLALVQPVLIAGVPRTFALINGTTAAAISIGLHQPLIGVPLGVVLHFVAVLITKHDPAWLDLLLRHLRQPRRLHS